MIDETQEKVPMEEATILIVDDDDGLSSLMQSCLRKAGFKTSRTATATQALDWLGANRADLMLLDHKLPDLSGKDVIRKLAQRKQIVPFVAVSGQGDEHVVVEMMKSGALDYVVKDDTLLELLPSVVIRAIEQHKQQKKLEHANEMLFHQARVNTSLAKLSKAILASRSIEDISGMTLQCAKELTSSNLAYVGYIDPETGHLICPTMTRDVWQQCNVADKNNIFEKFGGLWGWVLKNKKPLLTNEPTMHPASSGTPDGHIAIRRFLSAPCMIDSDLVGQIAVANGEQDYTGADLEVIERLADLYALAVQRKHDEDTLQNTTDTLNSVLDSATEFAIAATDLDFRILHYNQAAERIFGYKADQVVGKTVYEVHTWEKVSSDRFDKAIEIVRQDGRYEYNIAMEKEDGKNQYIHSVVMPMHNASGVMTGYILISHDVTKRKETEEEIVRLAKFPDENPNPVLRISGDGAILYGNRASRRLLELLKGKSSQSLSAKWRKLVFDAVASTPPRRIEAQCDDRIFSLTFAPIKESDYVNVYAMDITSAKGAEQQLRDARDELEKRVKERTTELSRTVSELQIEVTERIKAEKIILADQQQLRKMATELLLTEERERREIAIALHDSIGQILAFSSIELANFLKTAPPELAERLTTVRQLVEQAIDETRSLTFDLSPTILYTFGLDAAIEQLTEQFSDEHGIECSFETCPEPKDLSKEVEVLLFRAVRELLVNVVKHAQAGTARVSMTKVDHNLEIIVEDDGDGFDILDMDLAKGHPAGLGLFSVRERLAHLGGSLAIDSNEERGTKVTLLAPLKQQTDNSKGINR